MKNEIVFRPKGNFAWAILAIGLDILFMAQVVLYPADNTSNWIEYAIGAFIAVGALLMWVRPKLVLHEDHLVVVNPLSKESIAYKDINDLETKWTLRINHNGKRTRVWVAPANGKQRWVAESVSGWASKGADLSEMAQGDFTTISDSLASDSGVAAAMIRQRLKGLH
jgi:hypothetical protein